jgi:pimeloyl-ACP methyl ester carboxylesterase
MPGYGESSKHPEHAVDFGAQAKAFAALIEHWGLDRPRVVAHDLGGAVSLGAISLLAALADGPAYESLMLVDVVAIPPSGSAFFQFVKRYPTTLDELPPYIHEAILRAYVSAASHRGLRFRTTQWDEELAALVSPWCTEAGQPAFYRQIAQYDEEFLVQNERTVGNLAIPVKVVWGSEDAWIPPATGRRLAGLIPGASYVEVPDAGHLMQYEAPVALATELRKWLYF